jgi:hypothetical protein
MKIFHRLPESVLHVKVFLASCALTTGFRLDGNYEWVMEGFGYPIVHYI